VFEDSGEGTVEAANVYNQSGIYTVQVCVTDDDPVDNTDCDTLQITVTCADGDNDGVCDYIEVDAPNDGDGNNDGIEDKDQGYVASLRNRVDGRYVTLVAPIDTQLANVHAFVNPSITNSPLNIDFPVGFVRFILNGLSPGAPAQVSLLLPPDLLMTTYYKLGPTTGDLMPHWYEFLYDGTTGAELIDSDGDGDTDIIILHLVDGGRGDGDLSPDGRIVDPSAPGLSSIAPGDCNADSLIDAGDISALTLEIFDGDGDDPINAPLGSFAGDPVGCDSNEDVIMDAGDLSCTTLLIFDGPGACELP